MILQFNIGPRDACKRKIKEDFNFNLPLFPNDLFSDLFVFIFVFVFVFVSEAVWKFSENSSKMVHAIVP